MDTLRALLDSVLNWSSSSSDLLSFSRSSFSVWLSLLYMIEFFKSCVLLMTLYLSKVGTTFRRVPEFASSLTSSSDSLWSYRCDHSDTSRFQPSDFQVLWEVKQPLFMVTPLLLLDWWVQVVMPPFTALLSYPTYVRWASYLEGAQLWRSTFEVRTFHWVWSGRHLSPQSRTFSSLLHNNQYIW